MNIKLLSLVLSIFCFFGFKTKKSSNNDLRGKKEIFSIKEVSKKRVTIYSLESSISGQYNIAITEKGKTISNKKVDTSDAQKMDDEFVDRFISFKYLMKARSQKKCQDSYFLSLRGEKQTICSDEKDKIDKIRVFINTLKNHFS